MAFEGPEVIIILVVVVLLFWGPKKVPDLARSLGRAKWEFEEGKKGQNSSKVE